MKKEIKKALSELAKSTARLEEGSRSAKSQLEKDGLIKRFEFTFELLWKTLKIYLEDKGWSEPSRFPKDVLGAALKGGLLGDGKIYYEMLQDRNKTAHLYDEGEALKILFKIRKEYSKAIRKVVIDLQNKQREG